MSARTRFYAVTRRAQREAFAIVKAEIEAKVPRGWKVHFAVGWGFTVYDDQRRTVCGRYGGDGVKMSRTTRSALALAADYFDAYGPDNSSVEGRA
jgi:hypothetical protein